MKFRELFPVEIINSVINHGGKQNHMEVAAARLIGAGLAMVGTIGAGIGIGMLVNGAVQGIARNPDASGDVQTNMILGIAFTEAVAIYCLVVALLILFVG
jgi:F-type H+-transporting ATPase subunit c